MTAATEKKDRFSKKAILAKPTSPLQQGFYDFVVDGEGHGLVEARAGAGKSTSIVGAIARLDYANLKIAVAAFNVHSVEELKSKLPTSVTVATAHRFGMSALVRFFGGKPFKPNEKKYRDLAKRAIAHLQKQIRTQFDDLDNGTRRSRIAELDEDVHLFAFGEFIDDKDVKAKAKAIYRAANSYLESLVNYVMLSLSSTDVESVLKVDNHFCLERDFSPALLDQILPYVDLIIEKGIKAATEQYDVDLVDLIFLPCKLELNFPPYDFVFIDECQDASAAMLGLYDRMAKHGRAIFVGDTNQAIQGFAGADAYSVDRIREKFKPTTLPLSVCYRCPSSHLGLARRLVPEIQNNPDRDSNPEWLQKNPGKTAEGEVKTLHPGMITDEAKTGDLMICRFTAPLIEICLDLIQSGTPARVRGRDLGEMLTSLIRASIEAYPCRFPEGFDQSLAAYCEPRIAKYNATEQEELASRLLDRQTAILACYDSFGFECRTETEFCDRIAQLFCGDTDKPPVTLATIHRSKGDEADRVFLIGANALPFTLKAQHDWQVQQEENLLYVGLTRSKETLILVPTGKDDAIRNALKLPYLGMKFPNQEAVANEPEPTPIAPTAAPSANTDKIIGAKVTHPRKEGWSGIVYDIPWGQPSPPQMVDVLWQSSPSNVHETTGDPIRYPLRDLILG